jgi:hypothetical protein
MASTRTRNGRIIGLYRDAQGRQKSAGTWPTQAEALKAAKHAEALANPPETTMVYASEKRGHRTVAPVYLPGWLEGHRFEDSSREGYKSRSLPIVRDLGTKTLAEIEPADVRAFFRELEKGKLAASTIRHTRTVLNEMFKCAVIDGLIDRNPCEGVKVKPESNKEMMIATPAQAKMIRAAIPARTSCWSRRCSLPACVIRN